MVSTRLTLYLPQKSLGGSEFLVANAHAQLAITEQVDAHRAVLGAHVSCVGLQRSTRSAGAITICSPRLSPRPTPKQLQRPVRKERALCFNRVRRWPPTAVRRFLSHPVPRYRF